MRKAIGIAVATSCALSANAALAQSVFVSTVEPITAVQHAAASNLLPQERSYSMLFDGRRRNFLVHVPPGYDGTARVPLVLCLHGGTDNVEHTVKTSGLNEQADRAGFIVVYPAGTGRFRKWQHWDTGGCCGYAGKHHINDVGFLNSVVQFVKDEYSVDPTRVYATGFSNGAEMAYKLAVESPGVFAAIAPVSGWMTSQQLRPACPTSIIAFHGTRDKSVPLKGGSGKWAKYGVHLNALPLWQTIAYWAKQDGCRYGRIATNGHILSHIYTGGKNNTEVRLELMQGYGHAWPGGKKSWLFAAKPSPWISANDEMWAFFQRHHM